MTKSQPDRVQVWVTGPFSLFNQAFKGLLDRLPGLVCVGQSVNPNALPEVHPDLVLQFLPQPVDLETFNSFHQQQPDMRVLLLSLEWTLIQVRAALKAGAVGCLAADISIGELATALRQVSRGEVTLSAGLQRAIILELASEQTTLVHTFESLSPREQEVLALVCEGLGNKQIAQRLYLSVRTIENHLARLYDKLGVNSRTEAAVLALQQGWVKLA